MKWNTKFSYPKSSRSNEDGMRTDNNSRERTSTRKWRKKNRLNGNILKTNRAVL